MSDEELKLLQEKADKGGAQACLDYAIALNNTNNDYETALEYAIKAWNYNDNSCMSNIYRNAYIIYKNSTRNSNKYKSPKNEEITCYFYYIENGGSQGSKAKELLENLLEIYYDDLKGNYYVPSFQDEKEHVKRVCNDLLTLNSGNQNYNFVLSKIYFVLSAYEDGNRKDFLEKAVEYNPKDYVICERAIELFIDDKSKDLEKALKIVNECRYGSNRDALKDYIEGLLSFENKEYNVCLKKTSYKLSKQKGLIYYKNLGGGNYNIKEAESNLKYSREDSTIDIIKKNIDIQRQVDKDNYEKNNIVEINDLEIALKNELDNIYSNFEKQLKRIISEEIKEYISSIKLIFSYEKKEEESAPSPDEISKALKEFKDEMNNLNDYHDENEVYNRIIDDILEELDENGINNISKNLTGAFNSIHVSDHDNKLFKLFRRVSSLLNPSNYVTNGCFSYTENTITLYLSNIFNQSNENNIRLEVYLLSVFSHEIFHAIHYFMCKEKNLVNKRKNIIEETLASYFQYNYCENFKNEIKEYYSSNSVSEGYLLKGIIQSSWDADIYDYYYAGAKLLNQFARGFYTDGLYKEVFNKSLDSFDRAFHLLDIFYKLSNED